MKKLYKKIISVVLVLMIFLGYLPQYTAPLNSATLTGGSLNLSDSRPSTSSVTYTITFSGVTTSAIKCIQAVFSDSVTGGSAPTGMVTSGAALGGTSTYIPTPASWSVASPQAGTVKVTYATGETPGGSSSRTVILTGITNGSTADTAYYLQFSTFNNTDCSSSPVDSGVISYIYTSGQSVSATVDPSLSFSIGTVNSGQTVNSATTTDSSTTTTVPFGTLSASANQIVAHDLDIATNAQSGYTVTIKYTGTFNNGTHDMTNKTDTNASPAVFASVGTEEFGYTTEDTTLGTGTADRFSGGKWAGFSTTAYEVAYSASAVDETVRTGYQVGISATTPAGSYTTTVVYTATPTY